jgi:hypothetical protein
VSLTTVSNCAALGVRLNGAKGSANSCSDRRTTTASGAAKAKRSHKVTGAASAGPIKRVERSRGGPGNPGIAAGAACGSAAPVTRRSLD